ncbi:alanine racemase [Yoonia sediminilitoris]|uniref:Alanine racemase n=1 Tax=Yoonia sediminilitoris TaxID=1286148 RepID=A0A2T6KE13_9RHOB|nr:alanine racemase [Yoonia sediminilitoris]PUB13248.1 alanine racemase [Yoonia sediminilitoris]RCW94583.1 alanine racemase [Yoonia sediminilitoris]
MGTGRLTIDLDAVVANWRALDDRTACKTAAVVKANGYGLGAANVAKALFKAGARKFFVAVAEEAVPLREALGPKPQINVFSGHMKGDTELIRDLNLTPMLNSVDQLTLHFEALPGHPFGIQLDTGMNRLGMEMQEWAAVAELALAQNPTLVMSHLACSDEPDHPMNPHQLENFKKMTDGISAPRSLAATGGILLGPDYHFDLTRPGIGLYGGAPFADANPVVELDFPVVQVREVATGEVVGYGNSWQATRPSKVATVSGGYADGIFRILSDKATLFHGNTPCPLIGRVSMDLLTIDVTDLAQTPDRLTLLGPQQGVDDLAQQAKTIGYEVLTQLGARYNRRTYGK